MQFYYHLTLLLYLSFLIEKHWGYDREELFKPGYTYTV